MFHSFGCISVLLPSCLSVASGGEDRGQGKARAWYWLASILIHQEEPTGGMTGRLFPVILMGHTGFLCSVSFTRARLSGSLFYGRMKAVLSAYRGSPGSPPGFSFLY